MILSTQGLGYLEHQYNFRLQFLVCSYGGKNYSTKLKAILHFNQFITNLKRTRLLLTSGSRKVMKEKALKGFGMKTSVTSPNLEKYSLRSSAVISSVQRPTNTLQGTCCTAPSLLFGILTSHHLPSETEGCRQVGQGRDVKPIMCLWARTLI